jgi:SpoVK/Ycf46/Vps4 family AAA+-type ATPase
MVLKVGDMKDIYEYYVHITRYALQGNGADAAVLARKSIRYLAKNSPESAEKLKSLLADFDKLQPSASRGFFSQSLPIDSDSRLELLRREFVDMDMEPVWPDIVNRELDAVIEERVHEDALLAAGLTPTKSMLFVGPPGVGKTLAARWLSWKLGRPLLTLDLAAVMSSFLGRTGNNIRAVLNFAQKAPSVLLLDEFDAIAKKRNDDTELGELKRLVTVLLQAVDDWPPSGILLAATNHPELLDPAVWRRFERVVEFPNPTREQINELLRRKLVSEDFQQIDPWIDILSVVLENTSFAEVIRQLNAARRNSIVHNVKLKDSLEELLGNLVREKDKDLRMEIAGKLLQEGKSQRQVSLLTGFSRDKLRRHFSNSSKEGEI